jgi:hypothetical protein
MKGKDLGGVGDGAAQRVRDWFASQGGDGVPERPHGAYGPPPAQQNSDVSKEFKGATYKLVMVPMQQDPSLPHVRWPGEVDERDEASGFRRGAGVNPIIAEPDDPVEEYEPAMGVSRFRRF